MDWEEWEQVEQVPDEDFHPRDQEESKAENNYISKSQEAQVLQISNQIP